MGLVTKLMNNVLGNLAAGAVSSLMEADNKAADARKAEAQAKMQAYELQKKQMEEDARRRKKAEEIATIKAKADADKAALNVKLLDDKTFNTMRAGIVLSWYIAGIDGNISKDEERAVTQRIRNIRQTGDIPEKYRDALAELEGYRPMTFDEVKVYLDRADNKALVSLTLRAEYIAKMDGLSAVEKSAIDGVKLYVEEKTGYHFKDLHTMPLTVSMICPTCGGKLIPDASLRKATCDYCGFTKLVEYKS